MNTPTAVEQKSTQYPPGNGSGPVPEPPAGAPPAGQDGEPVIVQRLKAERVQEELKAMAGWQLAHEFPTPEVAALYTAYVTGYAAAAGFSVTVNVTGGQVCVTVDAPPINGCPGELTLPVLAFARQL